MNIGKSHSILAVHSLHFALLLAALIALLPTLVIAQNAVAPVTEVDSRSVIENLDKLKLSIETKRATSRELREQLKQLDNSPEAVNIEKKLERLNNEITGLQQSLEYVLLGGQTSHSLLINRNSPSTGRQSLSRSASRFYPASRSLRHGLARLTACAGKLIVAKRS